MRIIKRFAIVALFGLTLAGCSNGYDKDHFASDLGTVLGLVLLH